MSRRGVLRGAAWALLTAGLLAGAAPRVRASDETDVDPAVLDQAWQRVKSAFYDPKFRGVDWQAVLARYRPRAEAAVTRRELHDVVLEMLGELKASHTTLLEPEYLERFVEQGPKQLPVPQLGMRLTRYPDGFFVSRILPGSSAAAAGVRRGDRLIAIDGRPPREETLLPLPWEAGLGGPRSYQISCEANSTFQLEFERTPTPLGRYTLTLQAHGWNETSAGFAGRRVIEADGLKLGYVPIYHLLGYEPVSMTHEFLKEHPELDGMILDLRGRGGMPEAADKLIGLFDRNRVSEQAREPSGAFFSKPSVVLIDRGTRSVKELIAFEWRRRRIGALVGQTTRGAFLGVEIAGLLRLADGSVLMVPGVDMRPVAGGVDIEGEGVPPDVEAEDTVRYVNGADPILEAGVRTLREAVLASRRRSGAWR